MSVKMVYEKGSSSSGSNMVENEEKKKEKLVCALIVDDDAFIRRIHKVILKNLGVEAEVVENGQKAVDLHRQGKSFDFVFMDKEMPVKDGIQATWELRAMGVESIIVGVTSHTSDKEKQAFMEAGLDYCFSKPLTMDKVLSVLANPNNNNNNNNSN